MWVTISHKEFMRVLSVQGIKTLSCSDLSSGCAKEYGFSSESPLVRKEVVGVAETFLRNQEGNDDQS